VVNNVISLASVPWIMAHGGGGIYASFGHRPVQGTIPIQIAGNVKHGGLYEAPSA
jgi:formate dehydrogenase iron-sulfur subunit